MNRLFSRRQRHWPKLRYAIQTAAGLRMKVPMLIDSGADVTLLPEAALKRIAARVETDEGYELMAFDGSKSISRVVVMDLLFLKRTFKGRFLIIDQPWGVLGRNITNHLCLMLNGPGLAWDACPRS